MLNCSRNFSNLNNKRKYVSYVDVLKLARKVGQIVKLCEKWLACLEVSVYFIVIFVYFTHVITDWKNKFPLNATFIVHLWQREITLREWIISDELWTTWIILRLRSKREISHSQVNSRFWNSLKISFVYFGFGYSICRSSSPSVRLSF